MIRIVTEFRESFASQVRTGNYGPANFVSGWYYIHTTHVQVFCMHGRNVKAKIIIHIILISPPRA